MFANGCRRSNVLTLHDLFVNVETVVAMVVAAGFAVALIDCMHLVAR